MRRSCVCFNRTGSILGYAMACSNTFGLVTGAFLLGFGLSEIPKTLWRNADWTTRQKVLSHKIAKIAVRLDNAHQELSDAIVVSITWFKQLFPSLLQSCVCHLRSCLPHISCYSRSREIYSI